MPVEAWNSMERVNQTYMFFTSFRNQLSMVISLLKEIYTYFMSLLCSCVVISTVYLWHLYSSQPSYCSLYSITWLKIAGYHRMVNVIKDLMLLLWVTAWMHMKHGQCWAGFTCMEFYSWHNTFKNYNYYKQDTWWFNRAVYAAQQQLECEIIWCITVILLPDIFPLHNSLIQYRLRKGRQMLCSYRGCDRYS